VPAGNDFVAIAAGGFTARAQIRFKLVGWGYNLEATSACGNNYIAIAAGGLCRSTASSGAMSPPLAIASRFIWRNFADSPPAKPARMASSLAAVAWLPLRRDRTRD
jgi:hypothetical protein